MSVSGTDFKVCRGVRSAPANDLDTLRGEFAAFRPPSPGYYEWTQCEAAFCMLFSNLIHSLCTYLQKLEYRIERHLSILEDELEERRK